MKLKYKICCIVGEFILLIDAHVHLGLNDFCNENTEKFAYDLENQFDKYIKFMNHYNIDKSIVLPMPAKNYDVEKCNNYLIEAFAKYPDRFIPFCRMDKNLQNNIANNVFYGAKFHMVYEEYSASKKKLYYKLLEYYGVPLIIHAKFANKASQICDILNLAPNIKIIVAHFGRGNIYTDEGVEELLRKFKDNENVFFESSTVGKQRSIESACGIVGSERVLFGTDYPFGRAWFKDMYSYDDEVKIVKSAQITSEDKDNILFGNVLRMCNIIENNKKGIIIKPVGGKWEKVWEMLHSLDKTDINYLAINKKWNVIRSNLKSNRHVYILCDGEKIVGFFRESGRENGFNMLEEIVIFPKYRGQGYSKKIMDYFVEFFPKSYAKTHAKNDKIIGLLEKYNYVKESGSRIINWSRC